MRRAADIAAACFQPVLRRTGGRLGLGVVMREQFRPTLHDVAEMLLQSRCDFGAQRLARAAYLQQRRALAGEAEEPGEAESEGESGAANGSALTPERFKEMKDAERVILTVSENGYGKRTISYEYRVTGRGGKGIVALAVNARNGSLVASFPVEGKDEIMLVTGGGQLIRVPVAGIRLAGRATQGVIVLDTAEQERVVSVDRIGEPDEEEDEG